jgi:hypothetical protein
VDPPVIERALQYNQRTFQYNERAFQKLKHPLFNGRSTYGGRSPFERFETLAKGNSPRLGWRTRKTLMVFLGSFPTLKSLQI